MNQNFRWREEYTDVERRFFTSLGLTEQEWRVYTFLCKAGPVKVIVIARNLKLNRILVYEYLKDLQKKGFVEVTLGVPQEFLAVPPEKIVGFCVDAKKDELRDVVTNGADIISKLQLSDRTISALPEERVAVIQGYSCVFSRLKRLVDDCRSEFLFMISDPLPTAFFERFIELVPNKHNVKIRLITKKLSSNAARVMKKVENSNLNIVVHQATIENVLPLFFVVRDFEEALLTLSDGTKYIKKDATKALWTNHKSVIDVLTILFNKIWWTSEPLRPSASLIVS